MQFLFIDLLLILPIAIFSKISILNLRSNLTYASGVDWTFSRSVSKTANSKPGIKESIDSLAGADRYLHIDSGCGFPGCSETTLVSSLDSVRGAWVLTLIGISRLIWIERSRMSRIPRTPHCSWFPAMNTYYLE